MLSKFTLSSATILSLSASILSLSQPAQAQSVSFICSSDNNGTPTTYAQTPDGYIPVFKWTSNYFQPPYTPTRRCQEVSDRMNRFYDAGALDFLTSGTVNRQPVICAGSSCNGGNVLVTLKPGQSASQVLQELEANRSGAGGPSFQLNAGSSPNLGNTRPSAISRNVDGSVTLNLNRYLQNTPAVSLESEDSTDSTPETRPGVITPDGNNSNPSTPRVW